MADSKETIEIIAKSDAAGQEIIPAASVKDATLKLLQDLGLALASAGGAPPNEPPLPPAPPGDDFDDEAYRRAQEAALARLQASFSPESLAAQERDSNDALLSELSDDPAFAEFADFLSSLPDRSSKAKSGLEDLISSFDELPDASEDNADRRAADASLNALDEGFFDEFTKGVDKFVDELLAEKEKPEPFSLDSMLRESADSLVETIDAFIPGFGKLTATVIGAVDAFLEIAVAAELYSQFLKAAVEEVAGFSAALKQAQAQTEINRLQQEFDFANRFGKNASGVEESRSATAVELRELRAQLFNSLTPFFNLASSFFTAIFAALNILLDVARPILWFVGLFARLATLILDGVTAIVKFITFQWFDSSDKKGNLDTFEKLIDPNNLGVVTNGLDPGARSRLWSGYHRGDQPGWDWNDIVNKNTPND